MKNGNSITTRRNLLSVRMRVREKQRGGGGRGREGGREGGMVKRSFTWPTAVLVRKIEKERPNSVLVKNCDR
jgi:hypothetical protein